MSRYLLMLPSCFHAHGVMFASWRYLILDFFGSSLHVAFMHKSYIYLQGYYFVVIKMVEYRFRCEACWEKTDKVFYDPISQVCKCAKCTFYDALFEQKRVKQGEKPFNKSLLKRLYIITL